jgi:sporulation protein YlmC with PRC-barrel domain
MIMDIPVSAEVTCIDGLCGHSSCVIVSPILQQVTHLVVQEKSFPYLKRLVPIELIGESASHLVHLGCTKSQLATLRPYLEIEWPLGDGPYFAYQVDQYRTWPYANDESMPIPAELERILPGELAIHRDAPVKASNGRVGRVNEFLVNPANGHITHLVLRMGHLWGKRDVTIPSSEIERIEEDKVYLKSDKHCIEAMPVRGVRQ